MEDDKQVLGLELATDPRWVDLAQISLEELLTDHAYCEQKAATSCISLIQQYPDHPELIAELSPIVTEEWGHFRLVHAELLKRNLPLGTQRKDEYVAKLRAFMKKDGSRTHRLIEHLLVCAMIEARSCERFRLLSLGLEEVELKRFYHRFMVSEAGHYRSFIRLARLYAPSDYDVDARWNEYLDYESKMIQQLELRGDRMH